MKIRTNARTFITLIFLATSASNLSQAAPSESPFATFSSSKRHPADGLYFLEFAVYKNVIQAKLFAGKLTKKGAPCRSLVDAHGLYHVISDGYFLNLDEATEAFHLVSGNVGYKPTIKQLPNET